MMTDHTPVEEFSPLHNLIFSVSTDAVGEMTQSDFQKFLQQVQELTSSTFERMKSLSQEFFELKNRNLEQEEKIALLYENMDKQSNSMLKDDKKNYRSFCEKKYYSFWKKLDSNSQEFLITAHFIFDRTKSTNADFSPVIIEFCRVFENEMLEKIFKQFIQHQASSPRILSYQFKVFEKAKNAIDKQKTTSSFFLSSMDMLKLLSHMSKKYNCDSIEKALQIHISTQGFDTNKISNKQNFIEPAKNYIDIYRNGAAHPHFFEETCAEECKEKTIKYVDLFLSAKK